MKKFLLVLFAITAVACTPAPTRELTVSALPSASVTIASARPATSAPLQFESLGNVVRITAFARENKIAAGNVITVSALFEPVNLSIARRSDGSIEATSTTTWVSPNIAEMQLCTALDTACSLTGQWLPFKSAQEIQIPGDWIGERNFWMRAQFRTANGTLVPSIGADSNLPQESSSYSTRLTTFIDERTPPAAMPAKIQTLAAATRAAFPVTGFVKIENGRTIMGGKAGTTAPAHVQFSASSPLGDVKEMRVQTFGGRKCATDAEMNQAAWEPLVAEKIYPVGIVINFTSFDVSAQYRDVKDNLSPIYCADIAVEGSP